MAKAYFSFLDVLCGNHPSSVLELETPIFTQIVVSMQEGLKSLDILALPLSLSSLSLLPYSLLLPLIFLLLYFALTHLISGYMYSKLHSIRPFDQFNLPSRTQGESHILFPPSHPFSLFSLPLPSLSLSLLSFRTRHPREHCRSTWGCTRSCSRGCWSTCCGSSCSRTRRTRPPSPAPCSDSSSLTPR